jgi:2-polyprenyl-6-methoxyphenol hydroxylase-like FAD-dependent oxidoreductase
MAGEAPAEVPVTETGCCIVGGGPAGAVLALLLARRGIDVTLLEAHRDFDREFRGDTLHPSTLEILDAVGLGERLLRLPHAKVQRGVVRTPGGEELLVADFSRLRVRHPYVLLVPQARFLELVTAEAARGPGFHLRMGTRVRALVEEEGVVQGVRCEGPGGWEEIRAPLVVAADGRFSTVRRLAGLAAVTTSLPVDVLWFRVPRRADDPGTGGVLARLGRGRFLVLLDREDHWQAGYVTPKDGYRAIREQGIEAFRRAVAEVAPELAGRLESITDWRDVSFLSVASDRLPRWHRPGLLLIGDAAHVMSPAGGVGINYAIQDAVEAANVLAAPLKEGQVTEAQLAEVQRRREWPTRLIQAVQAAGMRRMFGAVAASGPFRPPLLLRLPGVRSLFPRVAARVLGWGFGVARVEEPRTSA